MSLSLADIDFLRSDRAAGFLARYAECDFAPANTLPLLMRLRKELDQRQASAILSTLRLRQRAEAKFPRKAALMLFTEAGLQQASGPLARAYRARLLSARSLLDCCCGLGADSLAFAENGLSVLGLDLDPVCIAIARHNAEALQLAAGFQVADVRQPLPAGYDCIFFDPARRDEQGRRLHHVERYQPPLSCLRSWQAGQIVVKLSPAVDLRQLAEYGGAVEFISVAGRLTEALLWLGQPAAPPFATKLTADGALHYRPEKRPAAALSEPRAWLFEPDPAILRARLVQNLALDLNATMLDPTIAYLTADSASDSPWGRYWRILDWMPFQLKRLRRYLQAHNVGRVTVKKRGFAMLPEELSARLRLKGGGESRTLALTLCRGKPIVMVCEDRGFG